MAIYYPRTFICDRSGVVRVVERPGEFATQDGRVTLLSEAACEAAVRRKEFRELRFELPPGSEAMRAVEAAEVIKRTRKEQHERHLRRAKGDFN